MEKIDPASPSHPALFLPMELPFGAAVGFLSIAVPYTLARADVPLDQIATLSATAFLPHAFKVAWVPLLDIGSKRKAWYLWSVVATAIAVAAVALFPNPAQNLFWLTILLAVAQVAAATSSAALNALVAITCRESDKGRAAGFYMAGNLGGTGLLGALALWLSTNASPTFAGIVMAAIVVASGAFALPIVEPHFIDEAVAKAGSWSRALKVRFAALLKDLWTTAKSREGFTGLLICLAPVGCAGMANLFSAIAPEFNASQRTVEIVNGVGSGIVGALGSFVGGYIADKMNRRLAYALSGATTALVSLAMFLSPLSPLTYTWGTLGYGFAAGIAYATWGAMVLEMVGHTVGVATKYALFTATSNFAISYVTNFNGLMSRWTGWGARGALIGDVGITAVGIVALLIMVSFLRRRTTAASEPVTV